MLSGTADLEALAARAPTMRSLSAAPVVLAQTDVLQVMYEIGGEHRTSLLPAGLHPTDPPLINWLVYRCATSPWGPFAMAQTRIECRSGLRLRAFLVSAVIDNSAAADAMREDWGFCVQFGQLVLQRTYDSAHVSVTIGDANVLDLTVVDPVPLDANDVQYVPNMNLAHMPRGLRLVQVEPRYQITRAERATPRAVTFEGTAWGIPAVRPAYPVSASLVAANITIPSVRFLCRPDVWAFEGTEVVA